MMQPRIHFRGDERYPNGSPTLREFTLSNAPVRIIQGPIESGKTVGSIGSIYKAMCEMPRCRDGIRRSRWLITRPTYSELEQTVRKDWIEWFNEDIYGKMSETEPYQQTMKFLDVEAEIVMMSFVDISEKTLRRLRSTQFTGAWVNEGQFIELRLFTEIIDRTGRYPRRVDCPAYKREKFAILDCNAPPRHDHWILYMRGDTPIPDDMPPDQAMAYRKPENWEFFMQPAAVLERLDEKGNLLGYKLNPKAENLQNMGDDPYIPGLSGKPRDQIDRDYRNKTVASKAGAPRYPMFKREVHVAKEQLQPYDSAPIILGMDFGLTPAATFWQHIDGRWYCLHSETAVNTDPTVFAPRVKSILAERFPFHVETGVIAWGDPQGGWSGTTSSKTSFQIFAAEGLIVNAPAKKDNPALRMSTGTRVLNDYVRNEPKVLLCPKNCVELIAALDGGMQMKQVKVDGTERVTEQLVKNAHSHVGEAAEYAWWGGGEARAMITAPEGARRKPIQTIPQKSSAFSRGKTWSRVGAR